MSPPPDPLPLIGYIRVSMAREEMISPAIQRASITEWAKRAGRRIVIWIEDLDMSGRNFKRKVMTAIGHVENGEAAGIAVYRYDRWGRNAVESLANCQRVELAGGVIESATEPLDASTTIGRYNRTNAFALAEMQSDIIGDNWKGAHAHRRSEGLPSGGGLRFGYIRLGRIADPVHPGRTRRDPDQRERYEQDPETADILADLYRRYVRGQGMTVLAAMLARDGIRNIHGRPWSDQALGVYLDSGFGAGLLRVHSKECRCGRPSNCRRSDYLPGAHDAVIKPDEWDAYLARRAAVSITPAGTLASVYPLAGLVRCGHCRWPMVAGSLRGRPGYLYRCTRWRDYRDCHGSWPLRHVMETAVRDAMAGWAADLELDGHVTQARRTARAASEVVAGRASRELVAADKALTRLAVRAATDEEMPEAVYEAAKADLLAVRQRAADELEQAQAVAGAPVTDFAPLIGELHLKWDLMPAARRREMLAQLLTHVTSYRTGHRRPARIVVTPIWQECNESCCSQANSPSGALDAAQRFGS